MPRRVGESKQRKARQRSILFREDGTVLFVSKRGSGRRGHQWSQLGRAKRRRMRAA